MKTNDDRLLNLSDVLASYSLGQFKAKAEISKNRDDLDTILMSVNMLGEELEDTTISRDFFSSIYNAVADMLLVLDLEGNVVDCNRTFTDSIGLSSNEITGKHLCHFFCEGLHKFSSIFSWWVVKS